MAADQINPAPDVVTLGAFALLAVLSGFNAVAVRFSNFELPPFWGAGFRVGVAAVIFMALVLLLKAKLPSGRALAGAALFGLLAVGLSVALVYWALVTVTAGLAGVMASLTPLATILLAAP